MKKIMILAFAALWLLPSWAGAEEADAAPAWLVNAIIKHESGGNPFALNIAGKSFFPTTRADTMRLIHDAVAAGKSYDVGLMQINRFWIDKFGIQPEDLLTPAINRQWGKWILAEEIKRHGLTWIAVGKYHSPDMELGRAYVWRIYRTAAPGASGKAAQGANSNADKIAPRHNLLDAGGIWKSGNQPSAGRFITFQIPAGGEPGPADKKP